MCSWCSLVQELVFPSFPMVFDNCQTDKRNTSQSSLFKNVFKNWSRPTIFRCHLSVLIPLSSTNNTSPLPDCQATVGRPKKKPGHLDRWPWHDKYRKPPGVSGCFGDLAPAKTKDGPFLGDDDEEEEEEDTYQSVWTRYCSIVQS